MRFVASRWRFQGLVAKVPPSQSNSRITQPEGAIMNIRKNFEALFLAVAALGLVVSFATANERPVEIAETTVPAIDMASIQTVIVSAPRLAVR